MVIHTSNLNCQMILHLFLPEKTSVPYTSPHQVFCNYFEFIPWFCWCSPIQRLCLIPFLKHQPLIFGMIKSQSLSCFRSEREGMFGSNFQPISPPFCQLTCIGTQYNHWYPVFWRLCELNLGASHFFSFLLGLPCQLLLVICFPTSKTFKFSSSF